MSRSNVQTGLLLRPGRENPHKSPAARKLKARGERTFYGAFEGGFSAGYWGPAPADRFKAELHVPVLRHCREQRGVGAGIFQL